jgi:ribosomal protein S15P/S13E
MLDESVATLEKHMSAHAADVAAARAELAAVAQRYALTPYATQRSGWYP